MKQEEIIKGNMLIAEFIGYFFQGIEYARRKGIKYDWKLDEVEIKSLKYHSDWNSIMPVVEKIESLGYLSCIEKLQTGEYRTYFASTEINVPIGGTRDESKILCVWSAVVQFINWRNETLKK